MLLLIDNYDSFTYNLAQYLGELGQQVQVVRNDQIGVAEIAALAPTQVVLSPGPCTPTESGVCLELLTRLSRGEAIFGGAVPPSILGVCLGHQAIAQAFGGQVLRARQAIHGKVWPILVDRVDRAGRAPSARDPLFAGLPSPFWATRYHSLVVDPLTLPPCLVATAWTAEGEIMALRHLTLPICGVQFHPESIGTPQGMQVLKNFLYSAWP